jgi:hypothetical protein
MNKEIINHETKMMIVIAALSVALVSFIIYALDRRAKSEPISWESAGKLSLFSGLLTAGVVFSTTPEVIQQATEVVKEVVPKALESDMFVGVPTF